jgi:hypothetical protein
MALINEPIVSWSNDLQVPVVLPWLPERRHCSRRVIAGAPPTRFACGREKQVSRLTKCPIEILNLRVIPTKKRVAFSSPYYIIYQLFHAQSFYNGDTLI